MLTSLWLLSQYQGNVNVDAHFITNYLFPQFDIDAMLYVYSGAPKKVRIDEEDQEFIGETRLCWTTPPRGTTLPEMKYFVLSKS